MTYESNLVPISELVNNTKTVAELKQVLTEFITDNPKFEKDEKKMLYSINSINNHTKGLYFFYNNILKYEKLGVV